MNPSMLLCAKPAMASVSCAARYASTLGGGGGARGLAAPVAPRRRRPGGMRAGRFGLKRGARGGDDEPGGEPRAGELPRAAEGSGEGSGLAVASARATADLSPTLVCLFSDAARAIAAASAFSTTRLSDSNLAESARLRSGPTVRRTHAASTRAVLCATRSVLSVSR